MQKRLTATKDALGRRSRTKRQPTGKCLTLRPRDLLWFEKLHRHGPLPTSYLLAFSRHLGSDTARALKRLGDLFHEGAYLTRPHQQFDTMDARFNQLVYDLDERAITALHRAGGYSEFAPRPHGPWKHRCMVACITASLELGVDATPHFGFIPQHRILERAGVGLRVPTMFEDPARNRREQRDLVPDGICGVEYRQDSRRSFRFFLIEADRHTEPTRSKNTDRKSIQRSILQYREFVGRGLYKARFNLTSNMSVLTVTTNQTHMQHMIDVVREIAPSGKNSFLWFQTAPAFARPFTPPEPIGHLFIGKWQRAGHSPAYVDRFDP